MRFLSAIIICMVLFTGCHFPQGHVDPDDPIRLTIFHGGEEPRNYEDYRNIFIVKDATKKYEVQVEIDNEGTGAAIVSVVAVEGLSAPVDPDAERLYELFFEQSGSEFIELDPGNYLILITTIDFLGTFNVILVEDSDTLN